MADAYPFPLLVELGENDKPKLTKLVKYFQSKKSNGGDCEAEYEKGSRTAVLRFRNEEDRRHVLEKRHHQLHLPNGLLTMEVRLPPQDEPAQEAPPAEDVHKSNVAVGNKQSPTEEVNQTVESQQKAEGGDDNSRDEELCSTSAVIGNITGVVKDEFLELLVENIVQKHDSSSSSQNYILQFFPEICSAVVTFKSGQENSNFISRCSQNRMFMNKGYTVRPLELTKQVVVEDTTDLNEEMLHHYFEGEFGAMEHLQYNEEEQSAVVTFQEHHAVKRVLEMKHQIKKKEIRVDPFYESLGRVLYGKDKPSLKLPAAVSEPIDNAVWRYLNDKRPAAESIHSDMAVHFCEVDLRQPTVVLSPFPSLLQDAHAKAIIKGWRDTVKSAFVQAVSNFIPVQFHLDLDIWEECELKVRQMLESEDVAVVPDKAEGVLSVVGHESDLNRLQANISDLIAKIKKRAHREKLSETEELKVALSTFHLLSQDGLKDKLLQVFPELKMSHEGEVLKVTGLKDEIFAVHKVIFEAIMAMKRKDLELDNSVLDLLKGEQLQQERLTDVFFTSQRINAAFDISAERVQLHATSDKVLRDAQAHLAEFLISQQIDVEDWNVLENPEWQHLVSQLETDLSDPCRTVIHIDSSQVVVSGYKDNVTEVSKNLNDFIFDNTLIEDTVDVKHKVVLEYIKDLNGSWLDKVEGKVIVSYKGEKICLKGTRADVTECKGVADYLLSSVFFDSLKVATPGVKKFFKHKEAFHASMLKKDTGCLACLADEDSQNKLDFSHGPRPAYQTQTADGLEIAVGKADLCSYPMHAVVNFSNEDLEHNSGLGAALLNAAGPQLQTDCDKYITSHVQLNPGQSMITSAGGQLKCKKVIHVVGPKFVPSRPQEALAQLKRGVKGSLELAEINSCASVALPAISRGLGFPLPLGATTIVKAVKEYCDENCDKNTLKKIHFINNDIVAVQAMVNAVRREFKTADTRSNLPQGAQLPLGTSVLPNPSLYRAQTKEGLNITLKKGYIEAATTEVTVNTVFQNLALNKGAVSNAILLAAGPKLQQQILGKQPSGNFGDIIVTDGCQLKSSQVFHAVTPQWDNGQGASEKILRGIFKDCLNMAENGALTSISFPAIGTGNLGFPKDLVASLMFDEIFAFSTQRQPKHLKKVLIIIFPGDVQTLQAFSDTFQKRNPSATSSLPSPSKSSGGPFSKVVSKAGLHETTLGSVTVQVVSGDITKETSDVIVNSSNDNFTLKSGVSKAVLDAAGPAVETECQNLGAQPNQGIILTQPGNLGCKQILHLSGKTDPVKIHTIMKEALQMCVSKNYTSVSFPALGTGQGGVQAKQVADSMLDAVIDVLSKNASGPLKTIRIVIFQPPMLNDFHSSMQEREATDPKNIGLWGRFKAFFSGENPSKPQTKGDFVIHPLKVEPACFHICGASQTNTDKAKQWIRDLISKEQQVVTIPDDAIQRFSDADHQQIVDIQKNREVSITTESKNAQAWFTIEGLGKSVLQANTDVYQMLKQVRDGEDLQRKVNLASEVADWQYKETGSLFKSFDATTNFNLEDAVEKKLPSINVKVNGRDYTVTMPNGPATDSQGGTLEIKRIDKLKNEEVPAHWDPMPANVTSQMVVLPAGSWEYTEVLTLFQATCKRTVTKIERIQNPVLWKSFQLMKRNMETRNNHQKNERQLFHGTCETTVSTINEYGFNRSYAGKNAACYGNGSYFAVCAQYSAQDTYSTPNQNQEKFMYLCPVLVGDFTLGKKDMIVPPSKGKGPVEKYDSVVDNVNNPSMYIIFHDIQAYPGYLITFK